METIMTVLLIVVIYGGTLVKIIIDGMIRDEDHRERSKTGGFNRRYISQADWNMYSRLNLDMYRVNKKYRRTCHYINDRIRDRNEHVVLYGPLMYLCVMDYWNRGEDAFRVR